MILAVDDDDDVLELVRNALHEAGYEVVTVSRAAAALETAAKEEPELVISDVLMPEMGGIEFRQAYAKTFPGRRTPFVFLSSLSDQADVVRGLDAGADDYLVKPVVPKVLQAKVRAHLRRGTARAQPSFCGDLGKYPFVKIMQFCELKGFTGEVEIRAPELNTRISFAAGAVSEMQDQDDVLEKLFDLSEGLFLLHPQTVSFSELAAVSVAEPAANVLDGMDKPMGRLSGVRAGDRLFQIQTEVSGTADPQVVTVVILDGKTVQKRAAGLGATHDRYGIDQLVREQHAAVEADVRDRLQRLSAKPATESPAAKVDQLIEDGLAAYLARDYAGALAAWEEAHDLDPQNKAVGVNIGVVRRKLGSSNE